MPLDMLEVNGLITDEEHELAELKQELAKLHRKESQARISLLNAVTDCYDAGFKSGAICEHQELTDIDELEKLKKDKFDVYREALIRYTGAVRAAENVGTKVAELRKDIYRLKKQLDSLEDNLIY